MPDTVRLALDVPADHRWLPLVRTLVSAAPDPAQMGVEEVGELGMLAAEVATGLVEQEGATILRVAVGSDGDSLRVHLDCDGSVEASDAWSRGVTGMLLDAIARDVEVRHHGVSFSVG